MSMDHKCKICGNDSYRLMNGHFPYCSSSCRSKLIWLYVKKKKSKEEFKKSRLESYSKYEKTFNGYLMRKYRNMKSRITGIQKKKYHLYEGLEILPVEEFYMWSLSHPDYECLFNKYKESGFEQKLAPSVDRIDSKKGYVMGNMRWITHSENSKLGNISKNKGVFW